MERFYQCQSQKEGKDVHMCISNAHDYIVLRISFPLISLPCRGKNLHPIVSNLLQVILPQPTPISMFYCSISSLVLSRLGTEARS